MRYLHWGARHCPWFIEPLFMAGFTAFFWILCGRARNAVAHNLKFILPGSSALANQLRAFRVFWNFAWTMTDLAHVRHGREVITWEVVGREHLQALEKKTDGAVLITAHMGNYDVAAPVFADRFSQPIHMVRAPERQRENQELQRNARERQTGDTFVVHYNEPGGMLGVELVKAIRDGGIVAIQGDRILFDVAPMRVLFRERVFWNVPRGPFTLALVAKTSIHPILIIRRGYRRYRVQAYAPITQTVVNRDKESAQKEAASAWSQLLRGAIEQHWQQWFVFEPVFEKSGEEAC